MDSKVCSAPNLLLRHRPKLLSDNSLCSISDEPKDYLTDEIFTHPGIGHKPFIHKVRTFPEWPFHVISTQLVVFAAEIGNFFTKYDVIMTIKRRFRAYSQQDSNTISERN